MTRWTLGLVTLATLSALTGCGASTPTAAKPATTPATATTSTAPAASTLTAYAVVLFRDAVAMTDPSGAGASHCEDRAGSHADVHTGAQIQLLDAAGKTVSADTLKVATGADAPPKNVCAWTATFEQVPAGQGPYTAQVGPFRSDAVAEPDLASKRLVVDAR